MLQVVVFYPADISITGEQTVAIQAVVDSVEPNTQEEPTYHVAMRDGVTIAQWSPHFPWVAVQLDTESVVDKEPFWVPSDPNGFSLN